MPDPIAALLAQTTPPTGTPPAGGGTPSTGSSGTPAAGSGSGSGFDPSFFLIIAGCFAIMYFLMIRPQQKKEKELRAMVDRMKKNDKVVLQGGIFGVVAQVREKDVIVKIDEKNDVRIRVLKSAVLGIEGKGGEVEVKSDAPATDGKAEAEKSEAGK